MRHLTVRWVQRQQQVQVGAFALRAFDRRRGIVQVWEKRKFFMRHLTGAATAAGTGQSSRVAHASPPEWRRSGAPLSLRVLRSPAAAAVALQQTQERLSRHWDAAVMRPGRGSLAPAEIKGAGAEQLSGQPQCTGCLPSLPAGAGAPLNVLFMYPTKVGVAAAASCVFVCLCCHIVTHQSPEPKPLLVSTAASSCRCIIGLA